MNFIWNGIPKDDCANIKNSDKEEVLTNGK